MDDTIKKIKDRVEEEACAIVAKNPIDKNEVMLLGQMVDILKDISTIETMDDYGEKYLDDDEYSERYYPTRMRDSYRRGRSPSTGRYVSMDSRPMMDGDRNMRDSYRRDSYNREYSGHSIHDRMIDALERMMDTAATEHERETIRKEIEEIRREK